MLVGYRVVAGVLCFILCVTCLCWSKSFAMGAEIYQ